MEKAEKKEFKFSEEEVLKVLKRHGLEKTDIRNDQMYGLRMGYNVFIGGLTSPREDALVKKYSARLQFFSEGTGSDRKIRTNFDFKQPKLAIGGSIFGNEITKEMKDTLLEDGFLILPGGSKEITEGTYKGHKVEIKGPILLAVDTELNKLAIGYLDKFEPKKILKGTELSEEQHAALKRGEAILLDVKGTETIVRFNPALKNISFWDDKAMEDFKIKLCKVPIEEKESKISWVSKYEENVALNKLLKEREAANQNQKNTKQDKSMPVDKNTVNWLKKIKEEASKYTKKNRKL